MVVHLLSVLILVVAGQLLPTARAGASALDALPAGPAPRAVPYAIGTKVHYGGHVTEVGVRFDRAFPGVSLTPAQRQLTAVIAGGGHAWAQLSGPAIDLAHVVGRIGPRGGWTGFHTSSGSMSRLAVTSTGNVVMPETGRLYRADGRLLAAFTGSVQQGCGFCAPSAAGPHVVVQRYPAAPGASYQGTWLWSPPATPRRLPDDRYRAVGRHGPGWVAAPDGAMCWRVAPASSPTAIRARICSQALPLVSADGARAVVVQAGRIRVVDTRTAKKVSLARVGALAAWSPTGGDGRPVRYLVPAAWETADSYLTVARDDRVLALVRCSARTSRCERAVRTTVRPGVDRIVTERDVTDVTSRG